MHFIKTILGKYSTWLKAALLPLGPWGVFIIGALDSAAVGLPLDPVVAYFVFINPHLWWLYVIMASAGSAAGSMILYLIGYKGGEALLEKRMPKARFEKIKKSFEDHEFLALMFPAMLPPPTPYKLIVLSAAAFEMDWHKFLLAIFLGRVARFTILSILVKVFGENVIEIINNLVKQHLLATLLALAGIVFLVFAVWKLRQRKNSKVEAAA
ncbi:MAG TPA: VTT domain-containing protein [Terriglobales bacterium]|nr:VTT domain-containing protein [Terriglobales bacterium]